MENINTAIENKCDDLVASNSESSKFSSNEQLKMDDISINATLSVITKLPPPQSFTQSCTIKIPSHSDVSAIIKKECNKPLNAEIFEQILDVSSPKEPNEDITPISTKKEFVSSLKNDPIGKKKLHFDEKISSKRKRGEEKEEGEREAEEGNEIKKVKEKKIDDNGNESSHASMVKVENPIVVPETLVSSNLNPHVNKLMVLGSLESSTSDYFPEKNTSLIEGEKKEKLNSLTLYLSDDENESCASSTLSPIVKKSIRESFLCTSTDILEKKDVSPPVVERERLDDSLTLYLSDEENESSIDPNINSLLNIISVTTSKAAEIISTNDDNFPNVNTPNLKSQVDGGVIPLISESCSIGCGGVGDVIQQTLENLLSLQVPEEKSEKIEINKFDQEYIETKLSIDHNNEKLGSKSSLNNVDLAKVEITTTNSMQVNESKIASNLKPLHNKPVNISHEFTISGQPNIDDPNSSNCPFSIPTSELKNNLSTELNIVRDTTKLFSTTNVNDTQSLVTEVKIPFQPTNISDISSSIKECSRLSADIVLEHLDTETNIADLGSQNENTGIAICTNPDSTSDNILNHSNENVDLTNSVSKEDKLEKITSINILKDSIITSETDTQSTDTIETTQVSDCTVGEEFTESLSSHGEEDSNNENILELTDSESRNAIFDEVSKSETAELDDLSSDKVNEDFLICNSSQNSGLISPIQDSYLSRENVNYSESSSDYENSSENLKSNSNIFLEQSDNESVVDYCNLEHDSVANDTFKLFDLNKVLSSDSSLDDKFCKLSTENETSSTNLVPPAQISNFTSIIAKLSDMKNSSEMKVIESDNCFKDSKIETISEVFYSKSDPLVLQKDSDDSDNSSTIFDMDRMLSSDSSLDDKFGQLSTNNVTDETIPHDLSAINSDLIKPSPVAELSSISKNLITNSSTGMTFFKHSDNESEHKNKDSENLLKEITLSVPAPAVSMNKFDSNDTIKFNDGKCDNKSNSMEDIKDVDVKIKSIVISDLKLPDESSMLTPKILMDNVIKPQFNNLQPDYSERETFQEKYKMHDSIGEGNEIHKTFEPCTLVFGDSSKVYEVSNIICTTGSNTSILEEDTAKSFLSSDFTCRNLELSSQGNNTILNEKSISCDYLLQENLLCKNFPDQYSLIPGLVSQEGDTCALNNSSSLEVDINVSSDIKLPESSTSGLIVVSSDNKIPESCASSVNEHIALSRKIDPSKSDLDQYPPISFFPNSIVEYSESSSSDCDSPTKEKIGLPHHYKHVKPFAREKTSDDLNQDLHPVSHVNTIMQDKLIEIVPSCDSGKKDQFQKGSTTDPLEDIKLPKMDSQSIEIDLAASNLIGIHSENSKSACNTPFLVSVDSSILSQKETTVPSQPIQTDSFVKKSEYSHHISRHISSTDLTYSIVEYSESSSDGENYTENPDNSNCENFTEDLKFDNVNCENSTENLKSDNRNSDINKAFVASYEPLAISSNNRDTAKVCSEKENDIESKIMVESNKENCSKGGKSICCTVNDSSQAVFEGNSNLDLPDSNAKIALSIQNEKEVEYYSKIVGVQQFDWDNYLEESMSDSTPPTAFAHVELSIETGIMDGQFVEVLLEDWLVGDTVAPQDNLILSEEKCISKYSSYWPAKVLSSCGLLLRLRYEGIILEKSANAEFWRDLSSKNHNLKPIGWSKVKGIPMKIPPHLSQLISSPITCEKSLNLIPSVPKEALEHDQCAIFARIHIGDLLEIQDDKCPHEGWVAKVKVNHGGWLLLQSLDEEKTEVWLFFLDSRIKPLHWFRNKGEPYRYKFTNKKCSADDESEETSLSFLIKLQTKQSKHCLSAGMCLEAVLPSTLKTIHVATISRIIDDTYFEVNIDDYKWVTTMDDSLIFPVNFCKTNGIELFAPKGYLKDFSWKEFLESNSLASVPPESFSKHASAIDLGFNDGQHLETVNPFKRDQVCFSTVLRVVEHLLIIQIGLNEEESRFFRSASSNELFPVGWSNANQLPLFIPKSLLSAQKCIEVNSNIQELYSVAKSDPDITDSKLDHEDNIRSESANQNSLWCDRLYINHCCYAGPYLSKSKIAKLSQSVGQGPVHLVLKEVLGRTINAAYVPTRVLRELRGIPCVNSSWRTIALKAKFRRHALKSTVNLATNARDVDAFLMELSKALLCCHNLWSFKLSGEICPYDCNGLNPTVSAAGVLAPRGRGFRGSLARRKRGKKRLLYPMKTTANSEESERQVDEEDDDEEGEEPLSGSEVEGASRPSSPLLELQRKLKQKRLLTSLEIHMNEPKVDTSPGHKLRGGIKRRNEAPEERHFNISATIDPQNQRKRAKQEPPPAPNNPYCLEPANVFSDPLEWSVKDVENYILSQPSICHHAVRLREHEVDGRAFMLLNLPTLVHYLNLPHSSAVTLAQHICKVKLAHFVNFRIN